MGILDNKVALVTGASKGIGAGIAKQLAAAGATVIVNYATSKEGAEKVVNHIIIVGGRASHIQGDFSKPDDITRVFAQIKADHGKLDILVNNAGVYGFGSLDTVTPQDFHRHFDLNVLGLLLATKAAAELMGSGGSVINIGSAVGAMPMANAAVYCATKGAVDSISISLSKELGPRGIRVNSLNPGMVATEGTANFIEGEAFQSMIKAVPLGRIGQPDDIAEVAVFLASDAARWVTGQKLNASGGQTM